MFFLLMMEDGVRRGVHFTVHYLVMEKDIVK